MNTNINWILVLAPFTLLEFFFKVVYSLMIEVISLIPSDTWARHLSCLLQSAPPQIC